MGAISSKLLCHLTTAWPHVVGLLHEATPTDYARVFFVHMHLLDYRRVRTKCPGFGDNRIPLNRGVGARSVVVKISHAVSAHPHYTCSIGPPTNCYKAIVQKNVDTSEAGRSSNTKWSSLPSRALEIPYTKEDFCKMSTWREVQAWDTQSITSSCVGCASIAHWRLCWWWLHPFSPVALDALLE